MEQSKDMNWVSEALTAQLSEMQRVKGEAFSEAVRAVVTGRQLQQAIEQAGATPELTDVHRRLTCDMLDIVLKALDMEGPLEEIDQWAARLLALLEPLNWPEPGATRH